MKRTSIFFLITLYATILSAQPNESHPAPASQVWNSGSIVLEDGNTLEGVLKYDLRADAVHLKVDSAIRTFVASQIIGFNFVQENVERRRFFISLPFEVRQGYERPTLFEVLYGNDVSLLAREEDAYSPWTKLDPSEELNGPRKLVYRGPNRVYNERLGAVIAYDYYLSDIKGEITAVKSGVRGVVRSFDKHHKELKIYIRRNKLDIKSIHDMAKLVDYYNSIEG